MASKLNITSDWLSASGTRIEGVYELRELISADGCSAIFRTLLPGDLAPQGLARLFHLNAIAAARQRDLWQALAQIPHQNLQRLFSSAVTDSGGELAACVVTEGADENLAAELKQRSLTFEEAGSLLLSVVPALSHLHTAGFVHGRVCPAEIFASGDTIKISSDCATREGEKAIAYRGSPAYVAPDQNDENITPAADVWCFGASLFEALTQKPFAMAWLGEALKLPAPFGRIIADCVDPQPGARPRLPEILALYQRNGVPPTVTNARQSVVTPKNVTPKNVAPRNVEPKNTPINIPAAPPIKSRTRSPLVPVLIAVAVSLVLVFLWLTRNKTADRGQVRSPDAKAIARQTTPTPVPAPAAVVRPAPAEQLPSGAFIQNAEPITTKGPIWRVVLWTYRKRSDAQSKVDSLAARFPTLHPEVFSPDPNGGLYLVVAGGEMTRKQAEDTQRSARQLGLPRDIYIQNFSH